MDICRSEPRSGRERLRKLDFVEKVTFRFWNTILKQSMAILQNQSTVKKSNYSVNRVVRSPYAAWCERCTSTSFLVDAIYSIGSRFIFYLALFSTKNQYLSNVHIYSVIYHLFERKWACISNQY